MALQWEPQWEDVIIEVDGVRLKVKRDKVTGLYMCPVCGTKKPTYFFTANDLIEHIIMHAVRDWRSERVVVEEIEVEEQEEEEERD